MNSQQNSPKGDKFGKYTLVCYFKTGNTHKGQYKKKQTFYSKFLGEQETDSKTAFQKLLILAAKFVEQKCLQSASIYLNLNFAGQINDEIGSKLLQLQISQQKEYSPVDNLLLAKISFLGNIEYYNEKKQVLKPLISYPKPFVKHHTDIPVLSHYSSFTEEQMKEYCLHLLEFGIPDSQARTIYYYLATKYEFRTKKEDEGVVNIADVQKLQENLVQKFKTS